MIGYVSGKTYTNRYRVEYSFEKLNENQYAFKMDPEEMKYCRWGGKEGTSGVDYSDLGMFDPSGGPYLCCPGTVIDGRKVIKLSALANEPITFTVE